MRSASLALLLQLSLGVLAKAPEADVTVLSTYTRTITVCPITALPTICHDYDPAPTTWADWEDGNGGSGSNNGQGSSLTSATGNGGNGATTSGHLTSTTSFYGNGTSTTALTRTTTPTGNSTATSTSCAATKSATGIAESRCNGPTNRGDWCRRKSVDDDTHDLFFTGETKKYSLVITSQDIDFDGTLRPAFAINGQSPGEAIVANWGDMVEVEVFNGLKDNATTIHWHGIRQLGTNDQDGVPGITECGIAPGTSRTYKWHASTYGTGWYHSHALSQYGDGIRGPLIIHGPATEDYDLDLGAVMLDETFSKSIFQMALDIARIRGALPPATNYLVNGKNKSPDGTKGENTKFVVKKGKKHLFRIINSSAQSSFGVHFDNHKMKVISADFTPIVPYETDTLWIQAGQRYNVIVDMNQAEGAYFLRAVTQTGCGISNANTGLGQNNAVFEYEGSCARPASGNFTLATTDCKDEPLTSLVPHVGKGAGSSGAFTAGAQILPGGNAAAQNFDGFGAVNRWYLGGVNPLSAAAPTMLGTKAINVSFSDPTLKTLATLPNVAYNSSVYSSAVVLDGPANSWAYFVIQNNFITSHPMHLHGHDFALLGQGRGVFTADMVGQLNFANPIRRDTALLFGAGNPAAVSAGWTVIGFETDNPGAWLMHCHIIWHADGGMALQYLERPSEIGAGKYYNKPEFKDECAAYNAYEASGGRIKDPYESGLKKRHVEEHILAHGHKNVVRHL